MLASLAAFAAALALLGGGAGRPERRALLAALPALILSVALNLRRSGYGALLLALALVPCLLPERRRAALLAGASLLLALALYLAAAWDRPREPWAAPAQRVRAIVAPAPGSHDALSNRYRAAEAENLLRTIARRPLGLGFGHPFDVHVPLDALPDFPTWRYHPHCVLLGLWVSLGTAGFLAFLAYRGAVIALAARDAARRADPYLRALAAFTAAAFAVGLALSLVDHYLVARRAAILMGALAGLLAAAERLDPARGDPA
jgi:hypothetical protein